METVLTGRLLGRQVQLETNAPAAARHLAHVFPTLQAAVAKEQAEFSLQLRQRPAGIALSWQGSLLGTYATLQEAVWWADFFLLERLAKESGLLVLHGACLAVRKSGVILLGSGAAGKSGLSKLLLGAGFRYGSDEAVGMAADGRVYPFCRALLLKGDHPDVQKGAAAAAGENLLYTLDGRVYETPALPFVQELEAWRAVELVRVPNQPPRLEQLPLCEGLSVFVRHTLQRAGWRQAVFQQLVNRLAARPAFRLSFSDFRAGAAHLAKFLDRGEDHVENG